ncbi:MAG: HAMP domain-containing protein [Deltaproteobacteria bacterium]|nr:HAMP domain-containing protein [Candidatus Tharpellaceae bacterium]
MKLAFKLALTIFLTGTIILVLVSYTTYQYDRNLEIKSQCNYSKSIAEVISQKIDQLLIEKTKTALALAYAPLIKSTLDESNSSYTRLTETDANRLINRFDADWKGSNNENEPFILKYTDNRISHYFKKQQSILKDEYGEIFLTNKLGALVATTSKLSTFAHGYKYWWLGSYDNGEGSVFFDDRGYDTSVGGYVLGVVIPVKNSNGIDGILKCNLNILGAISKLISGAKNNLIGDFKLVRSGGEIVFEKGVEPLSTYVPKVIREKMKDGYNGSLVVDLDGKKWLVGLSEIKLTTGQKGYRFGGSFESIDHKKGNTGESWYVLNFREMKTILLPVIISTKKMAIAIVLVIFILAIVALLLGHQAAHPIVKFVEQTKKIAKGNFAARIESKRKDEFGILAQSFNSMAEELAHTTTSIKSLEDEIALRKKSETEKEHLILELKEALSKVELLSGIIPICASCKKIRDDKGYWNQIELYIQEHSLAEFSHGLCPECAKKLYPEFYNENDAK